MKIEHNEPDNTCTHEYPIKNIEQNLECNHGYAMTITLENNTQITLTTDEMATIERIYNQIYYKQDLITKLNERLKRWLKTYVTLRKTIRFGTIRNQRNIQKTVVS